MLRRGENVVNTMQSILPWNEKFNGACVYTNHEPVQYAAIMDIRKISGLPQKFVAELEVLQRMQSNRYAGRDGSQEECYRPQQHTSGISQNKKLSKMLNSEPKGKRIWTTFIPEKHRHIYGVFETIIIDSYALHGALPILCNEKSDDAIDSHVKNYDTKQNTSVFCYLMQLAHTKGKTWKL